MTGRNPIKLIMYEAKKKPKVAYYVDRAGDLTDAEIAAADLPMPWMRGALQRLVEWRRAERLLSYAEETPLTPDDEIEEMVGAVVRFVGETEFFKSLGRTEIEIPNGAILHVTPEGVWYGTVIVQSTDLKIEIVAQSVTRDQYVGMMSDAAGSRVPASSQCVIDLQPPAGRGGSHLAQYGVVVGQERHIELLPNRNGDR